MELSCFIQVPTNYGTPVMQIPNNARHASGNLMQVAGKFQDLLIYCHKLRVETSYGGIATLDLSTLCASTTLARRNLVERVIGKSIHVSFYSRNKMYKLPLKVGIFLKNLRTFKHKHDTESSTIYYYKFTFYL